MAEPPRTAAHRTSAETGREPRKAAKKAAAPRKATAMQVARAAARQLTELTGRVPECVIGIQRSDDGWVVDLEVLESRRIPDSADILATYRVRTDENGDLTGYHRVRRYLRGKAGDAPEDGGDW